MFSRLPVVVTLITAYILNLLYLILQVRMVHSRKLIESRRIRAVGL